MTKTNQQDKSTVQAYIEGAVKAASALGHPVAAYQEYAAILDRYYLQQADLAKKSLARSLGLDLTPSPGATVEEVLKYED